MVDQEIPIALQEDVRHSALRFFGDLRMPTLGSPDDLVAQPKKLLEILLNERGRVVSKDALSPLWPDELPQNPLPP